MITFNLIGTGRLGLSLGCAVLSRNLLKLRGICGRNFQNTLRAATLFSAGTACSDIRTLPFADICFIACADGAIPDIVHQLSCLPGISQTIFVHFSGTLSSVSLRPLSAQGARTACLHPLRAFTRQMNADVWQDCYCTLEGDANACEFLKTLFSQLGAQIIPLDTEKKTPYHAAAVMASNYLVTLANSSETLLQHAGFSPEIAHAVTVDLLQHSLKNLQSHSNCKDALTGPLSRGDTQCIQQHLLALRNFSDIEDLYRKAALATLGITGISCEQKEKLREILLETTL